MLEPWIIRHHLHERCFSPALAQLRLRRLNRLGLAASKIGAINVTISELILAGNEGREPPEWTRRLEKDLQDLALVLLPVWIDGLWEPHYDAAGQDIRNCWRAAIEPLINLRTQPRLMTVEAYATLGEIRTHLPRQLSRR